jgi:hypothetical protein
MRNGKEIAMISSREQWIEKYVENDEHRELLLNVCKVYNRLIESEEISIEDIIPIVDSAKIKYMDVWVNGAYFLWNLSVKFEVAREAIRNAFKSKKVNERFQIMATVTKEAPTLFIKEIIKLAINDKGNRVREKAAQACYDFEYYDMVAILEERMEIETHKGAKEAIEFFLKILRDGYLLKPFIDGKYTLYFRTNDGGTSGVTVSAEEINDKSNIIKLIEKKNIQ